MDTSKKQFDEALEEATAKEDVVNHPKHYTNGGIECIDALESALGKEGFRGFLKGNVIKYVWRCDFKNKREDLKKAEWYLKRLELSYIDEEIIENREEMAKPNPIFTSEVNMGPVLKDFKTATELRARIQEDISADNMAVSDEELKRRMDDAYRQTGIKALRDLRNRVRKAMTCPACGTVSHSIEHEYLKKVIQSNQPMEMASANCSECGHMWRAL